MTLGGEAGALVGGEALMLMLAEPGARALCSKSPCGYRIAFLAGSSRTSLSLFFWKKLLVWPQQRVGGLRSNRMQKWTTGIVFPFLDFLVSNGHNSDNSSLSSWSGKP